MGAISIPRIAAVERGSILRPDVRDHLTEMKRNTGRRNEGQDSIFIVESP
jgi:hypothetical protein